MSERKYIVVLGDGMADEPVAELGDKTPLAYADTPAMDGICKNRNRNGADDSRRNEAGV